MRVLDASSIIYAWDNYPLAQFPGVWRWLEEQIQNQSLAISTVALEEVAGKTPECSEWLEAREIRELPPSNAILQEASRIKHQLGIVNDKYHPKGVSENDLIIIATAKLNGASLISDERRQNNLPKISGQMKIPAVCGLPGVDVKCINFVDYLKQSNEVFR